MEFSKTNYIQVKPDKTHRNPEKPIITQWRALHSSRKPNPIYENPSKSRKTHFNPVKPNRAQPKPSRAQSNSTKLGWKTKKNNKEQSNQVPPKIGPWLSFFLVFFLNFIFQVGAGRNRRATQFVQGLFHAATLPPLIPTDKAINTHQSRPSRSPIFFLFLIVSLLFCFCSPGIPWFPKDVDEREKEPKMAVLQKLKWDQNQRSIDIAFNRWHWRKNH